MSMITIGLDENKKYSRAVPPGGFTSNAFDYEYEGSGNKRTNLMRAPPSTNNNLNHTNVYGYETDSLDNVRSKKKVPQQNQNNSKQNVAEPFGYSRHNASRFASALETPALDMTTTEKMRTPRGLLRRGVPGEGQQAQEQAGVNKNPPGGGSSDFWSNM